MFLSGVKNSMIMVRMKFLGSLLLLACVSSLHAESKPNFVIIFTDDQGYGDLGCFGGKNVSTPRIDQMAAEGAKLTNFYVGAAVCTPSRAALMTGCYPRRVDMAMGVDFGVSLPGDSKGLNPDEITIAEVLKSAGYATGMFGKWHLGDQPEFLPTRQGFDEFFGLPYSHDIHPFHPNQKKYHFPPLPLLEGEKVVEKDPDAKFLTKRFTERAIGFIEKHKNEPFFVYLPHPIPHRPLYVSPPFMKDISDEVRAKLANENGGVDYKTRDKIYRQAISEIDWSVGQILDALKANDLDGNTIVIFTSDNGPKVGSAGPLKGKKGSFYEGGPRVPAVIRWPGHIQAGQTIEGILTAMDLFPTFAKLASAEIPKDRVIDGMDILPVLNEAAASPRETYFYHQANALRAVRSGKWKLYVRKDKPAQLFDIETDVGERKDVTESHPEVVSELMELVKVFEKGLRENSRPAGYVEDPKALTKTTDRGNDDP